MNLSVDQYNMRDSIYSENMVQDSISGSINPESPDSPVSIATHKSIYPHLGIVQADKILNFFNFLID